jgi:hypothetical protein
MSGGLASLQGVTKTRVLELVQGGYNIQAELIMMIGNPGLGKPSPTIYPHGNDGACI